MSISSIITVSSQSISLSSSSKTSNSLEYQAVLNEALSTQVANNQNGIQVNDLISDLPDANQSLSYSYTQTTFSFYEASSVNASSLATLLSQTTTSQNVVSSNGIDATKPSEYGYNIDDNGFFGSDFNIAAGLLPSFRVNTKMMETAQKYALECKCATPMQVFAEAWKVFQEVCGNKLNMDKEGYVSMQDARNLPEGYTIAGDIFDKLLSVDNTSEEFSASCDKYTNVQDASNAAFLTGINQFIYVDEDKKNFDERVKTRLGTYYGDNAPDGKVAVGQLFAEYFNTTIRDEAVSYVGPPKTKAFYKFLDGDQSFSSYAKSQHSAEDIEKTLKYFGADYFTKLDDLAAYFKNMLLDSMLNQETPQQ